MENISDLIVLIIITSVFPSAIITFIIKMFFRRRKFSLGICFLIFFLMLLASLFLDIFFTGDNHISLIHLMISWAFVNTFYDSSLPSFFNQEESNLASEEANNQDEHNYSVTDNEIDKSENSKIIVKNSKLKNICKFILSENYIIILTFTFLFSLIIVLFSGASLNLSEINKYNPECMILQLLIVISSCWGGYKTFKQNNKSKQLLMFGTLAILYNPILIIPFKSDIWGLITIITCIVYFILIIKNYNLYIKNNNNLEN